MEEFLICPTCNEDISLLYKNDEVVSQSNCKCRPVKLDSFFKLMEMLNEELIPLTRKVSIPTKTSKQRFRKSIL
jgi:Zn-finger nucleic acid-binding protein